MTITFGNVRTATLALLDEYNTSGAVSTTADVTVKIRDFNNKGMQDLAATTAKIHGEQFIPHAPVCNTVQYDTSTIKTFLPGGADITTSLLNAQACFFEITGPATVVIEEAVAGSTTYTALETITVASSVTTFTECRRLIAPTLATNTVRLRFTGSYVFYVRNYILYPYAWATEAAVQQHRPFFEYSLASDYMSLDNVKVKKDTRQYIDYSQALYILRSDKKICFNRYDAPAEFLVHYWRYPTLFTYTGTEVTDDTMVYGIDTVGATYRISDEAALILPHYIAGHVLISASTSGLVPGLTLLNMYEVKKVNLSSGVGFNQGTVISVPSL